MADMNYVHFDPMCGDQPPSAVDIIRNGVGYPLLAAFLRLVRHVTGLRTAMIGLRQNGFRSIVVELGAPSFLRGHVPLGTPAFEAMFDEPLYVADTQTHPLLNDDRVVRAMQARQLLSSPLPMGRADYDLFLIACDPRVGQEGGGAKLTALARLADLARDGLLMLDDLAGFMARDRQRADVMVSQVGLPAMPLVAEQGQAPLDDPAESSGVVSRFLLDTLLHRAVLHRRGGIAYTTLTRWRASIRAEQIAALRALKTRPPRAMVEAMASEIAEAACQLGPEITMVGSVACGHSGPDCLSDQLGRAVAARMNWRHVDLFETVERKGSSHPRRNAARPRLKLIAKPEGTVLIVDDVATSGQHLADAATLVRATGAGSVQIAYIKS